MISSFPGRLLIYKKKGRVHLNERESAQKLAAVDKERAAYYNQYSDKQWGSTDSYDLCIDTEKLGIEGTVDLILACLTQQGGAVHNELP